MRKDQIVAKAFERSSAVQTTVCVREDEMVRGAAAPREPVTYALAQREGWNLGLWAGI